VDSIERKTIQDFGQQWTQYRDNSGFYGSPEIFEDMFGALLPLAEVRGKRVADIGSGTGRIVRILLAGGAAHVVAVEPSDAFEVLVENTKDDAERITYLHALGEELPLDLDIDLVITFGVLHHIPNPAPVMERCLRALKPGGRMVAWLYGWEGNETYLRIAVPMRKLTTRLPHRALALTSKMLNLGLDVYIPLAKRLPVPLAGYMKNVVANLTREKRELVIYDQLCPAYARYYRESEARALFEDAGFEDVRLHHRHGYSWTVSGRKPK
jgi:SAM-dependent methyltransferase